MKFSKASAVVALTASTGAAADSAAWDPWTSSTTTSTTTTSTTTWDWPSSSADPVWDPWTSTTTSSDPVWDPWTSTTTSTTTSTATDWDWSTSSTDPVWDPWTSTTTKKTTTSSTSTPGDWDPWTTTSIKNGGCKPDGTATEWAVLTSTSTATSTATVYTTLSWDGPGTAPVDVQTSTVTVWPNGPGKDPVTLTLTSDWASDPSGTGWPSDPSVTGWPAGADPTDTSGAWPTDPAKWGPGVTSIIGTNDGAGWTLTDDPPTWTQSYSAPTYTPGAGKNCTAPSGPLPETGHNDASDRSKWLPGFDITTDYYQSWPDTGRICAYTFDITNTTLDFDGTPRMAFAINGQSPGPLIECNWGDTVQITVTNNLENNGTAIHWHGIRQKGTNSQDGVPGIAECAIAPGETRTYTWVATSYGSSWYHSHWLTQYGDGIKGPIIIHGPATANYDYDMGSVIVSDIFNLTAAQTYEIIAHTGPGGSANYLLNGKNTKPDLSAGEHALWTLTPGKKHLFRFVNSASQNMWSIHFDNHVMEVIAADFVPIVPYTTEWLNIAIGQRFDVIVTADQDVDSYFLRAVTQLGCPSACDNTGLGSANGIIQYDGAPSVLPTSTPGNVTLANFGICNDEPTASLVPYVTKTAGALSDFEAQASTLPAGNVAFVGISDGTNVFKWFLNGASLDVNYTQPSLQTIADSANASLINNALYINGDDTTWVYFVIQNQFFAGHPIHLHGHDFSLLGQGAGTFGPSDASSLVFDNPPRRDTAMLEGNGWTVIAFETDNPGAWLMHCHIVWHVDGGLAMQFVERESEIKDYVDDDFKNECSTYATYEAANPAHLKSDAESGLRRRGWYEASMMGPGNSVVRKSSKQEKRYLENYVRRGMGDGYKPRHGARR